MVFEISKEQKQLIDNILEAVKEFEKINGTIDTIHAILHLQSELIENMRN